MMTHAEHNRYYDDDYRDPFSMPISELENLIVESIGDTKAYLTGILHDRQMTSVVLGVGQ